jgi:hypothetical protein
MSTVFIKHNLIVTIGFSTRGYNDGKGAASLDAP